MPTKVLIVDDEVETCRMFELGLKMMGFETDYALNGTNALTKMETAVPDVLVLDLMLPDLDGIEVTRRLRANAATAKLPIIIVSATSQVDAREHCLTFGANEFLAKPVSARELSNTIKRLLS